MTLLFSRKIIILVEFNVKVRGEDIGEELGAPVALDLATLGEGASNGAGAHAQQQKQNNMPPLLRDGAPASGKRIFCSWPNFSLPVQLFRPEGSRCVASRWKWCRWKQYAAAECLPIVERYAISEQVWLCYLY